MEKVSDPPSGTYAVGVGLSVGIDRFTINRGTIGLIGIIKHVSVYSLLRSIRLKDLEASLAT